MSMFYELMMRKKEEIMYLVIKGNLTQSPDGVFSGFSNTSGSYAGFYFTDYDSSKAFHWHIKFQYQSPANCVIFGRPTGTQCLLIAYNGLRFTIIDSNSRIQLTNTWTAGQWYEADLTYDGISEYVLSLYSNGTLIDSKSLSYSNAPLFTNFCIGSPFSSGTGDSFNGSIDLNNSYIKLGSTKYKLQAVVGYTVVGSPTITDGVVSGFSTSNYLLLGANVPYSNNFEMVFKITTGSSFSSTNTIFEGSSSNNGLSIAINTSKYLYVSAGNGSWIVNQAGTTTLSANTTYYVKFSCKNNVYKLELSTDNINWNTEISVESSSVLVTTSAKSIGYSTRFSGRVFSGSIDMNETYIKINNKLWFNGQQA